jgi:urease accessory protein
MLVADEYLGSLDDPDVAERVERGDGLTVTLDDTERRRSRVRTMADAADVADGSDGTDGDGPADDGTDADTGTDLGIVVGRELRDGDVLLADGRPVVVSLEPVEAMALDFGGVDGEATAAATAGLELGHAVGNRHWDLAVEGERAVLPVTEDRDRMASEVEPHLPNGVTVAYERVSPALFDDGTPDHSHDGDGDGHSHSHGDGDDGVDHSHSHEHGDGDDHSHSHQHDDHSHEHGPDGAGHAHGHSTDHGVRSVDPDGGDES